MSEDLCGTLDYGVLTLTANRLSEKLSEAFLARAAGRLENRFYYIELQWFKQTKSASCFPGPRGTCHCPEIEYLFKLFLSWNSPAQYKRRTIQIIREKESGHNYARSSESGILTVAGEPFIEHVSFLKKIRT